MNLDSLLERIEVLIGDIMEDIKDIIEDHIMVLEEDTTEGREDLITEDKSKMNQ